MAGALPTLPLEDRAFDLVLSANVLMVDAPLAEGGMHAVRHFGDAWRRPAKSQNGGHGIRTRNRFPGI